MSVFRKPALLLVALLAIPVFGQERGNTIFQDSFDTPQTFAENWVPKDKIIKSEGGKIIFPGYGALRMRASTPLEFYAEMDVTVNTNAPESKDGGFCGFAIDGFKFLVRKDGITWMIYKLNEEEKRTQGKTVKIDGFESGKPIRLTLIRKIDNGGAQYVFKINGNDAGNFVAKAPVPIPNVSGGTDIAPLEIMSYNMSMSIDNFSISTIKRDGNDSPNLIINSSFEHTQDGFPLYFTRGEFDMKKALDVSYDDFLTTWTIDTNEKHSGNQSLKIVNNGSCRGPLSAWGAGTVKDAPGVFSAWMKSDQEDFPVTLTYGKSKDVKVGKEWRRYEFVNEKLPAPGIYSPVRISAEKKLGTLWVDDLQAEVLASVDPEKVKAGELFATPYKASELDKMKFSKPEAPVRAPEITVPKLPAGLVPNGDLDSWKDKAMKLDKFYFKGQEPKNKTEAYLACDDKNLYLGYRCFVSDLSSVKTEKLNHDSFAVFGHADSVEFFMDPSATGKFYQFATDAGGTLVDIGIGREIAWSGDWKSVPRLNEKTKSIDYEITIPFSAFAGPDMKSRWLTNICRNDTAVKEHQSIANTPIVSYWQTAYWAYAQFPADVIAQYSVGAAAGNYSDTPESFTVSFDMVNRTGKALEVNAELIDLENKAGTLGKKDIILGNGAGPLSFDVKSKTNKVCLKLRKNGETLASQTIMLEKRSPLTMLGRLSFYMNEPEAQFKAETTLAEPEKLTAVLTLGKTVVKQPASAKFKIALPLKDVADGAHEVKLALMKGNEKVAETTAQLVKRPYWEGATQINHFTRSLMHGGKPVFQVAPFFQLNKNWGMSKSYAEGLANWLEKYGFKSVHMLFNKGSEDDMAYFLDLSNKKGINVMLWSTYNEKYTDDELADTIKKLNSPNILSQMVLDEPELGKPSDTSRDFLRKMRQLFPYQPTHMNNTVMGIPSRYANLETDILMLDDYLTNRENRTVASVVDATDIMRKAGKEEGKPCFYFIVGRNIPLHYREPSYAEQIAQTYGNIAAGCTGFSYFSGNPATPGNWKALLQLNKEILSLNDVLLSEEDSEQAVSSADPKLLRSITKKHEGFLYLVACNIDANPAGKVTFTLPAAYQYSGDAEVMFEDRNVSVKDGKFTDEFAGHTRHVYKIKLR